MRRVNGKDKANFLVTLDCVVAMMQTGNTVKAASVMIFIISKNDHHARCLRFQRISPFQSVIAGSQLAYQTHAVVVQSIPGIR